MQVGLKKPLPFALIVFTYGNTSCNSFSIFSYPSSRFLFLFSCIVLSNGSMFNKNQWEEIANLGQYNLHVAITVMSFEEHTYQILSGTRLPISQIESNLFLRILWHLVYFN